jgi:hypothetical protein
MGDLDGRFGWEIWMADLDGRLIQITYFIVINVIDSFTLPSSASLINERYYLSLPPHPASELRGDPMHIRHK